MIQYLGIAGEEQMVLSVSPSIALVFTYMQNLELRVD